MTSLLRMLFTVLLVFSFSVNAVAIDQPRDLGMTVEEFADLIGYKSVRKLSLGTFEELFGERQPRRCEVVLKVDIYRNRELVNYADYGDYESFMASDVIPLEPDETIIIST